MPRHDQGLRTRPAFGKAALDKQLVDPDFGRFHRIGLARDKEIDHKVHMRSLIFLILAGFSIASCAAPKPVSKPVSVPQPPVVRPAPQPAAPAIIQPTGHWLDWPMAAGTWVYRRDERGSIALYGSPGADALVTLRCEKTRARLYLSRAGGAASGMTVRTSSTSKTLGVQPTGAKPPYVASELLPTDPILDAMAFSRGRIAIEAGGLQNIAIPVWSEIGRVIEDCRA
jgi:hypothetical protein